MAAKKSLLSMMVEARVHAGSWIKVNAWELRSSHEVVDDDDDDEVDEVSVPLAASC